MRTGSFIIFLSIFFSIYSLSNIFIYFVIRKLFNLKGIKRLILKISHILIASLYISSRFIENYWRNSLTESLAAIGSFYLAVMLYLFLLSLTGVIIWFILKRFSNAAILTNKHKDKTLKYAGIFMVMFVSVITIYGYHHACSPQVKYHKISISKSQFSSPLRIAFVSDIHLGTIIKNKRLNKMVTSVNSFSPDIILLGGDIVDEDIAPVIKYDMGALLTKLNAPLGVFGVTGNHEYIGGVEKAVKYLEDHNITMLRDKAIIIPGRLILIGREDFSITRFTSKARLPLSEIINNQISPSDWTQLPSIIVDHQPYGINEAITQKADFMMSGHTHNGQLWPIKYIVSQIFKIRHGLKKFEDTWFLVSSGYGTWGPPVRVATDSEIIIIDLFPEN
ncbi:MAG TPA: metallophosphoesterase [Spirochaetota bacterium]|nr:metallophosphoesterase [Spirochaetota bacterium]